jgi:hypothetical protein
METTIVNNPKFIYKDGNAVEVIIDIETYTRFKNFINKIEKKKGKSFTVINGVTIVRNGSPKTGIDIVKQAGFWKDKGITDSVEYARALRKKAHTRLHMKEALKSLNK